MQAVKSCCCGCTLRTGTLILFWLGAVGTGLSIFVSIWFGIQQSIPFPYILIDFLIRALVTGIYVIAIYGVEKERPAYLKPYLGLQVFIMATTIISAIALPIFGSALLNYLTSIPNNKGDASNNNVSGIVSAEISFFVGLGLTYYFFIVVLSFFKELKGEIPRQ